MADIVSPEKRSQMMSGIKGKDTKPELLVRKALHRQGFRYVLHDKRLPGKPDLVFPKYKAVIFVHGCFWHGHDCHLFKWPKSRPEFWREKITKNRVKDLKVIEDITKSGWKILTIWECSLKGKLRLPLDDVIRCSSEWLRNGNHNIEISGNDLGAICIGNRATGDKQP